MTNNMQSRTRSPPICYIPLDPYDCHLNVFLLMLTFILKDKLRLCCVSFQCDLYQIPLPVNARPLSTSDGAKGCELCQLLHDALHFLTLATPCLLSRLCNFFFLRGCVGGCSLIRSGGRERRTLCHREVEKIFDFSVVECTILTPHRSVAIVHYHHC